MATPRPASPPAFDRRPGRRLGQLVPRKALLAVLLTLPAVVLVGGTFVLPIAASLWMSVSKWSLLGQHHFLGVGNYLRLFHDPGVWRSFAFTAVFAAVVTPLVVVVGLLLALLVQTNRPGIGVIRTAIFAPVVVGNAAASYLWLALTDPGTGLFDRLLNDLHLAATPPNWLLSTVSATVLVGIATLWKTIGFSMIVLMNGLNGVPNDVVEAAMMDGASSGRTLWSVKLPLMKASIAFVATFTFIGALLTFEQFYIITGGGPNSTTISAVYAIYNTAFTQLNLGYAAAISIVFMAIILILTTVQLRLFQRGST
jgi:multiple sugar transport system permease protein